MFFCFYSPMQYKEKIIVILGPTATGKTKLAVKLAKRFGGEIISADSRQVYRGMDIGTGKDLREYIIKSQAPSPKSQINSKFKIQNSKLRQVPYHLIDITNPKKQFTVAEYQFLAYKTIDEILKRGKLPIICGGTGLYISAVVEGYAFPESQGTNRQSRIIRKNLSRLTFKQLLARLKKIDPATYKIIDQKNRRRVERALEIYYQTGKTKSEQLKKQKPPYDFLLLGLTFSRAVLSQRIEKRLQDRLEKQGMIDEVKRLQRQGLSWQRLDDFGLEYRFISRYLRRQISYDQMLSELKKAIVNFSKRQMTWFKADKKIRWFKNYPQAEQLVKRFTGFPLSRE